MIWFDIYDILGNKFMKTLILKSFFIVVFFFNEIFLTFFSNSELNCEYLYKYLDSSISTTLYTDIMIIKLIRTILLNYTMN
jgi:hypothetical protein